MTTLVKVGECSTNDGAEVMKIANAFKEQLSLAQVPEVPQRGMDEVGVFNEVPVDMVALAAAGSAGLPFKMKGVAIIFRKMGSNPGARIDFVSAGRITQLYPGCRIMAPFDGGTLVIGTNSSAVGTALLTVVKLEGYDFIEPAMLENLSPLANLYLLGSSSAAGVITYVTVNEDTDPSGAQPTGSFMANGFRSLILLIDGLSAAANATSFDLVPWYDPNRDGDWHEQGTQRVSVPDSDTTGFRYRVVAYSITPSIGDVYFSVRNLLAAARTSLGMAVIGVA